jgi:hypothetical protein
MSLKIALLWLLVAAPAHAEPAAPAPRTAQPPGPTHAPVGAAASEPGAPAGPESDEDPIGASSGADGADPPSEAPATGVEGEPPLATPDDAAPVNDPPLQVGPALEPDDPAFIGPPQVERPRLIFEDPQFPSRDGLFGGATPPVPAAGATDDAATDDITTNDASTEDGAPRPPPADAPAPLPAASPAAPSGPSAPLLPALDLDEAARRLMPRIVLRGVGWAALLAALAGFAWLLARALNPVRDLLSPSGVLPTLVNGAQIALRVAALLLVLGVIAAIVPRNLEPVLPVVLIAAAVAIGWSWRDLLPDLVAGLVLAAERRILPGQWVSTSEGCGIVEQTTLRVTRIRDATGRLIALPNRSLIRHAVVTDRGRWPTIEIELHVPGEHAPSTVRRVIEDAVLVSPWAAPVRAQMIREEREPGRWRVRARVLESRFADRFEGGLREHVEEILERGSRLRS